MERKDLRILLESFVKSQNVVDRALEVVYGPSSRFVRCENCGLLIESNKNCQFCVDEDDFVSCSNRHYYHKSEKLCPYCESDDDFTEDPIEHYKSNKKSEILNSLKYLRSKETQSKKDKESIQMLEAVLKNFS